MDSWYCLLQHQKILKADSAKDADFSARHHLMWWSDSHHAESSGGFQDEECLERLGIEAELEKW
jgi:hypothetical protein